MNNFKCVLLDQGIHIQGDAQDLNGKEYPVSLLLTLGQEYLPWEKAADWAKEQGGALPTRAQWQGIHAHRAEINAVLEAAGEKPIAGWYWTCEAYDNNPGCVWAVCMKFGHTDWLSKGGSTHVRAVSAFGAEQFNLSGGR